MKILLLSMLLIAGFMTGCARNHYNVPIEYVADKVKVLGVAPIVIDVDSDIKHPQKDLLVQLINDLNRKYEPQLIRKLKATGNFDTVVLLDSEPRQLFESLMFRREKREDATIQYNKYFWNNNELSRYIQKNNLDAVMLITVSGLTKTDEIYSSNLLTSLKADYNFLTITAHILDSRGTILWEYPNFRSRLLTYYPLINLQYPDFSESEANRSRETEVKFKNLDGIRRTLEQKRTDWLLRETIEPEVYGKQFDEMVWLIKYDLNNDAKHTLPAAETPPQRPVDAPKPAELRPEPLQETQPVSASPTPSLTTPESLKVPPLSSTTSDEIVPATDSTR